MSKITLNNVADLTQVTSAQTTINTNSSTVQTAFDNTLSRDGTSPNQMLNNLDMNNNQVLNLPSPATVNSPARLIDVTSNPSITVPPVGTSGAVVPLLNTANTWSGAQTFNSATNTAAVTASGTVTAPAVAITGATSGSVTIDTANVVASGTTLVPNGPATLLSTAGTVTQVNGLVLSAVTSTTPVMLGFGSSFTFTPKYSTRAIIQIQGQAGGSVPSATVIYQLKFGTGTAPVSGAAATGTSVSAIVGYTAVSGVTPACFGGVITGLTVGTAYWIDLAVDATSGSANLQNASFYAVEI